MNNKKTLGIIGVRGFVGRELLSLLADDQNITVSWLSSRQLAGETVSSLLKNDADFKFDELPKQHYFNQLAIENLSAEDIEVRDTDIIVLALPNGLSEPFVKAIERRNTTQIVIDLSADYRFDDLWNYSVPELNKTNFKLAKDNNGLIKISNPGCYATAMQIAISPLVDKIEGRPHCFGISGFSGAGSKPSANNNPENLKNNILPYALLEHLHEREVSVQLGLPVTFTPHVAAFFRGITMTTQIELKTSWQLKDVMEHYQQFYKNDDLIKVSADIPTIQQVNHTHNCLVGGFKLSENGQRLTLVSCLDNLLKGAASQALQNIYLALKN